ncbi:DUF3888 domain-containing protein [Paenibacillus sp.]|jgi:hypothetical protein|uniref:DUF3888 domain-containing protein n=1 Tax=Paenibacillus sp. TaxID=58172 RepID=UPI00283064BE|nr:DUF3888 domain-containing protein [Paenibacillus sp.]MDR0269070.1 DUF3888 domain-containing protein [Paenibacillus sp.]
MKTRIHAMLLLISILLATAADTAAAAGAAPKEPKLLLYQDMVLEFLLPDVQNAVNDYYKNRLPANPLVYPYQIDILQAKRINGGPGDRGFHFSITLETTPVLGPHIAVGKDRMTFEVSPLFPDKVKLVAFKHLQTFELPSNLEELMKNAGETGQDTRYRNLPK